MRPILAILVSSLATAACGGDEPEPTPPTVAILAPGDGESVAAGDVALSIVVTDFDLVEPGTAARRAPGFDPTAWLPIAGAWAHGDEAAKGWVSVQLDGAEVLQLGDTQGTLTGVTAGAHELVPTLIHEDGEPVEPATEASVSFPAE